MEETLSTQEAADLLGIHRATVVRWCQARRLAGAYLPRRSRKLGYRVPRASVLALLEPAELAALPGRQTA
jgi:excisionase family DNA binding protein